MQRILLVAAHPDDVDFGSAGTIATWTGSGIEVSYCIVTDGDAGGFDPKVPRSEIGVIRQDEQRKAAATLGVTDVEFLGYPDGRLTVSFELRRDITRAIRRTRPDRVVVQSPIAICAVSTAATPITWQPARPRCARSTPTPATRSRILSCSPGRDWMRTPCPRSG